MYSAAAAATTVLAAAAATAATTDSAAASGVRAPDNCESHHMGSARDETLLMELERGGGDEGVRACKGTRRAGRAAVIGAAV